MKRESKAEPAQAKVGSWKVTEELDSIQCPICKGYNRLSISSDKTHVYCAECGDRITEAYLKTQCFDLRVALERESNPAPASCGQHTPGPWHPFDYHGQATIVQNQVGQAIADCDVNHYIDKETKEANARLIAAAPELIEALRECEAYITALAKHTGNQTDTWDSATMAGKAQAKARTILAKIGGKQ